MINIEVITHHSKNGSIRPIRIRLVEDNEHKVFDIKSVNYRTKFKDYIVFNCEIIINDTRRNISLIFYPKTLLWYIKD